MGIKFQCPNGHTLNVKSFLAGKRGICPQCDAKFLIPWESGGQVAAVESKKRDRAKQSAAAGLTPLAEFDSRPASPTSPATAPAANSPTSAAPFANGAGSHAAPVQPATPVQPVTSQPAVAQPFIGQPASVVPMGTGPAPAQPVMPQPTFAHPLAAPSPAPLSGQEAIDEAPAAIWYVRPPSGGQFGPAAGEIMRKWIGEGRVAADALVWREGWTEWQQATAVFPQLGGGGVLGLELNAGPTTVVGASSARVPARRKSNTMTIVFVVVMAILAVILTAVFWIVISR